MRATRLHALLALLVCAGAASAQPGKPEVINSPVEKGTMSEYVRHTLTRVCSRAPKSFVTDCSKQVYTLTLKNGSGKDSVYALDLSKAASKDGKRLVVSEIHEIDQSVGGDVTMRFLIVLNPADATDADARGRPLLYRGIYDAALRPLVAITDGPQAERFLDKARRDPETRIFRVIEAP